MSLTCAALPAAAPTAAHPVFLISMELDGLDDRTEAPELVHPVAQCALGYDNNVWALDAPVLVEVRYQADGLQRLT